MKYITLTQDKTALVNDEDYEFLSQFNWYAQQSRYTYYAVRKEDNERVYMHNEILIVSDGMLVDHADGNGLNNQRYNLRPATEAQNRQNARIRADNVSGYKGVSYHPVDKNWRARIQANGISHYLGAFNTAEEAADAYAIAQEELHMKRMPTAD